MADVLAMRDEYRAQQWAMLIQECKERGLTNKEFCELRGVSEKSVYYWQRKFREQIVEAATPQLVPMDPFSEQKDQISFRGVESRVVVYSLVGTAKAIRRQYLRFVELPCKPD